MKNGNYKLISSGETPHYTQMTSTITVSEDNCKSLTAANFLILSSQYIDYNGKSAYDGVGIYITSYNANNCVLTYHYGNWNTIGINGVGNVYGKLSNYYLFLKT